ncbi:L,D-transpeptidase family protein [Salinivibrio proteolyticus]|uniref:L,D-transpeptidase family protein n=1 Tax=Salinivibrio proteolyticus TaxID=334715 RepID=A0ABY7LDD6_9GAMM|nr:L,D-transpeptidase family protein [Salinivibrio proteolyticus]WBA13628.1 L,D-transpeptidase family protein [Salinivibrio proteolyticus]
MKIRPDAYLANLLIVFSLMLSPVHAASPNSSSSVRFLTESAGQSLSADEHHKRAYQHARDWLQAAAPDATVLAYPDLLTRDYLEHGFVLLWERDDARYELETQVNVISLAGISPEFEWRAWQLRQLREQGQDLAYDVFATDTLYALLSYQAAIPQKGKQWFFGAQHRAPLPAPALPVREQVFQAGLDHTLYAFLYHRRPANQQYRALVTEIIRLQQDANQLWPTVALNGLVRPNEAVATTFALNLVENLRRQGFWGEDQRLQAIDGHSVRYGGDLLAAVREFQGQHGLTVDGIIGPSTARWLNRDAQDRIRLLALNAERLRLWPDNQPNRIVVNIPDYRMTLWFDDQSVFESKVVVGRTSRRTPLFSSRLDSVVLNPSWNVPQSIVRRDILPKLARDESYLSQNHYRILPDWHSDQSIDPTTIDWQQVRVDGFPYRLQQAPGKLNALGRFKFNTPNRNAIYLHDTPARSLFSKSRRAFSSGCIRVEYAEELANVLLDLSGQRLTDYQTYLDATQTKWISLRRPLAVQTIYQTAWVTEGGRVAFRDDVYAYDTKPNRDVTTREPSYLTQQRPLQQNEHTQ